jgi:hypothetical protein
MRWARGRAEVEQLLADGRLEQVTGAAADGTALLRSAQALLDSAVRERDYNPEAAYVLAYDAARKAATGLLAHQGLRPKSTGHHVTVETAVRAQFGDLRLVRHDAPTARRDRVPATPGRRPRAC